tara:strand:+ start:298 stop:546 length:249 start_codon:yes stop_codon:yes gene_type:complete
MAKKTDLTNDQVAERIKDKVKGSKVIVEAVEVSQKLSDDMPGIGKAILKGLKNMVVAVFSTIFWKVPIAIFVTPFVNAFRSK